MIKIDYNKCDGCNGCVETCPVGALERKDKLVLDTDKCVDCGACVSACKSEALSQV